MSEGDKYHLVTNIQDESSASVEEFGENYPSINARVTQQSSQQNEKRRCPTINYKPFLGFVYTALSSIFILLSSVIVKKLTYIDPGQLCLVRNLGVLVGSLPIAVYSVNDILGPRKHWCILLIRSFFGATALYLNLLAYRYLPLAVASIIMATIPALVTVAARIFLKEPCGLVQSGAIVLTILGMLMTIGLPDLISKGTSTHLSSSSFTMGLSSAVGCVILLSFTYVSLRKMTDIHFSVVEVYFGVVGTIENAVLTAIFSSFTMAHCGWDSVQVMLVGILGFVGQSFLTLAIQTEAAGIISVLRACVNIVVSMIFEAIFFDMIPDKYNFAGAFLVMVAMAAMGIRTYLLTLPEEHDRRRTLKCFLL